MNVMKCEQVREQLFEVVVPEALKARPELSAHVSGCAECGEALRSLQGTMALLDEWKAPETSAFFHTRLRARLAEAGREEAVAQGWWSRWLTPAIYRPAMVAALGLAVVFGISFYQPVNSDPVVVVSKGQPIVNKGTAVGDLQVLEKEQELFAELDLLDDIAHQDHNAQVQSIEGSEL
ncbi:MAG TPA: hypothetical protein VM056_03345 [Terriglobales bacterium]|nr:hypothetical protein [Terriglobales bacterium]